MSKQDFFTDQGINSPVLLLAPMEGITNPIFREEICKIGGVDLVATEFIRITGERQKVKPFHRHTDLEVPLQIQVMGSSGKIISGCIHFLKERGLLFESDWLDLNVGCPSKKVNARGAGAALLKDPDQLLEILHGLREQHSGPLSMKTRLGFDDTSGFAHLLKALSRAPINFLTIHARTRCDGYDEGTIKHSFLAQAVDSLPYPVIGNGEIWNLEDAERMLSNTGVAGIMCGRGAIANPYLFWDLRTSLVGGTSPIGTNDSLDRVEALRGFALRLLDRYLEATTKKKSWLGVYKEFSVWFCRNPLVGKDFFQAIKREQSLPAIREQVERYFDQRRLSAPPELQQAV